MKKPPADCDDVFALLMKASDQFSLAERLRLASHLVDDAHSQNCAALQRDQLIQQARVILKLVDAQLLSELTS